MITPQELTAQLMAFYGIDIDMTYAFNYIDLVGETAEVNSFYLWLQSLGVVL